MPVTDQETALPKPKTELDETQWAVISFDRCEASSLTYKQAAQKLAELQARDIAGLCIVTNDVAKRLAG